jgi:hypothetical protein
MSNSICIMKSPEFNFGKLEQQFNEIGFVHIRSFLSNEEIIILKNLFDSSYNYNGEEQGMWNSLYNVGSQRSAELSVEILAILDQKLSSFFNTYKAPVASFMVKNPNKNGITELHRDYTTQDEDYFQYRNIWIPLVDTTSNNGALYAVKYSHRFFDYPLPMFCKWSYSQYQDLLFKNSDFIDAKAGDLVVYADRTLHGSFINQTKEPRPVVHFGLLHPEAELCYYWLNENTNEVTVYETPLSFYFENNFGNQDSRFPIRRKFVYSPPVFSEADIRLGLKLI